MSYSIIQHRRGTTADWELYKDWILEEGEIGVEFCSDGTALLKVGTGSTPWSSLKGIATANTDIDTLIATQETLNIKLQELQATVGSIQSIDGLEYVENKLYLTSNGEVVSEGVEIVGGSGGSSASYIDISLESDLLDHNLTVGYNQPCNIPFIFTSKKMPGDRYTGNFTCSIYVGDVNDPTLAPKASVSLVQLDEANQPLLNTIDVSEYLFNGLNNVKITCTDKYGNSESLYYTVNVITLTLTSYFDDSSYIKSDSFRFDYIPTGGAEITKTVYFILDNEPESTAQKMSVASSAVSQTYWINLDSKHNTHGKHTLDVYMTATVNGALLTSNKLSYELMIIDEDDNTPIITSLYTTTQVKQGDLVSIPYQVYDKNTDTPKVTLSIWHYDKNNNLVLYKEPQQITINTQKQYWNVRDYPIGEEVQFKISYKNEIMNQYKERIHYIKVIDSGINITPVTENLQLALSSAGRENKEDTPATWMYNGLNMAKFTDFNWNTNGWITDAIGDTCLRVSGNARVEIQFKPFAIDFKEYGKTIELEFAVRDVNNRNAIPIQCFENTNNGWIGLKVTPDTTTLQSVQNSIKCNYKEEQKIRVSISIEPVKGHNRFISMYLDGVLCGTAQYTESDLFNQNNPVNIKIGSDECSIDIYNIRVYNTYLDARQILQNYIAGTSEFLQKISIYEENDIYNNETLELSYSKLKSKVPTVTFIGKMPTYKGDKKKNSVRMIFEHPEKPELNFDEILAQIDVQGTSSAGYIRKNWKTKHNSKLVHMEGELPAKVFCLKVDYAECTGTHNTQNANLAETFYSEPIPLKDSDNFPDDLTKSDIADIEKVRTTITGYPIVIFHLDTNDTHLINNITKAELEQRSDVKFSSKGNFNYDKGAENVFGFESKYNVECWEFCETENQTCFLTPFPENHAKYWEARFHSRLGELEDAIDDYGESHEIVKTIQDEMITPKFKPMFDWVHSTARGTYTEDGVVKNFATGEELPEVYIGSDGKEHTHDTDDYRLAKFQKEFTNWFDLHYTAIYYVYTFFALMTDQRAKNLFLTYWPDNPYDPTCETGRFYPYFYDNDTCFGINNTGDLKFDYYHEDDDTLDSTGYVFNGRNSVLWCNFRDAFQSKIRETYKKLRSDGKISYNNIVDQFINEGSSQWSASVYNEDAQYKYISIATPESDWYPTTDATEPKQTSEFLRQVRGNGEQHLKYFIQNRIKYCDSKWQCGDYPNNLITLRIFTPQRSNGTDEASLRLNASLDAVPANPAITVVPYSNMYCGVTYGADSGEGDGTARMLHKKAQQGETVVFKPSETDSSSAMNEKETYIYGASEISSLGDLSPLYCGKVDVAAATKLTSLIIGNSNPDYINNNLTAVSVGANNLLTELNVANCPNLKGALDVHECLNIETILAKGSGISSIELPNAGYVQRLELPETITSLVLTNQMYLSDISLDCTSITTLRIENCPKLNIDNILNNFKNPDNTYNISNLRLTDINWVGANAVTYDYLENLKNVRGLTENNLPTDYAYLSGTCEISGTMTSERMQNLKTWFPQLNIIFHNLSFNVTYMDETGTQKLYESVQTIKTGNTGEVYIITDPVAENLIDAKYLSYLEKAQNDQYTYHLAEGNCWSAKKNSLPDLSALRNVFADTTLYLAFSRTVREHLVEFYLDDTLLDALYVKYGSEAVYEKATELTKPGSTLPYVFDRWEPSCDNITGPLKCYATFKLDDSKLSVLNDPALFAYTTYTNKTVSIAAYKGSEPYCIIPETLEIGGQTYTVTSVGGFNNSNSLVYVKLPSTLQKIAANTFESCNALERIDLPDSVTSIGSNAFHSCTKLRSIKLPNNPEFKIISEHCFNSCTSLTEIEIPSSVTTLGVMSLYNCINISNITIPASVNSIGMYAFKPTSKGSSKLSTVTFNGIPNAIHSQAFEYVGRSSVPVVFNVPWSQSETHGEPWNASYYTINYNS